MWAQPVRHGGCQGPAHLCPAIVQRTWSVHPAKKEAVTMHRCHRVVFVTLTLVGILVPTMTSRQSVYARTVPRSTPILRVSVKPSQITLGRDVPLRLTVTDAHGRPVDNAVLSVTGVSRPAIGMTRRGALILVVRANRLGWARVQASRSGYTPTRRNIPIVSGPPVSIGSIVPPALTLPPPRVTPVTLPGPAAPPAITLTGAASTTTWSGGPYLIQGNVDVPVGTTLTIAPGTVLEMDPNASLTVEGTLLARGTASAPIVFTSSQAQPRPGDWGGIVFNGTGSRLSVLDYVQVFYGGGSGTGFEGYAKANVLLIAGTDPTISNSAIAQSGSIGIYVDGGSRPTIVTCLFLGGNGPAISLPAQGLRRVHNNVFAQGQQGIRARR